MYKRYSAEAKIKFCEEALKKAEDGTTMKQISKALGIPNTSLHTWLIEYDEGKLQKRLDSENEIDIPKSLIEDMTEEFNEEETEDIKDLYAWDMLYHFIEIAKTQGEITAETHRNLSNSLDRLKPNVEID